MRILDHTLSASKIVEDVPNPDYDTVAAAAAAESGEDNNPDAPPATIPYNVIRPSGSNYDEANSDSEADS